MLTNPTTFRHPRRTRPAGATLEYIRIFASDETGAYHRRRACTAQRAGAHHEHDEPFPEPRHVPGILFDI